MHRFVLIVFLTAVSALAVRAQDAVEPDTSRPADVAARDRLAGVFAEVEAFAGIDVTIRNGVAKLSGSAPSPSAREAAAELAASMDGVLYVENRVGLPVAPATDEPRNTDPSVEDERLTERLRAVFARVSELDDIEISVSAGVVILEGETRSAELEEKAEELAARMDGVIFVDNRVRETTDVVKRLMPDVERLYAWGRDAVAALPLLMVSILVMAFFWFLSGRVGRADSLFGRVTKNKLIQGVVKQVARSLVILVGAFLALEVIGATALIGAVLGTAGVVGLAVGFAFRDIVENYLASIILSVRQPFRSKDLVQIGEHQGTVVRLTTRDTVLMSAEGNHLTLPNSLVFKSTILNLTRNPLRRFDTAVGVGTDVDLQDAIELGLDVLRRLAGVVDDPEPFARIESLGDSDVKLRFFGWVDQSASDFGKVKSQAVRLIKAVMDENEIDMPVPTYQIKLDRPGRDGDAERPVRSHTARDEAQSVDVAPERHIEEQVDRDTLASGEEDLLDDAEPAGRTLART